MTTDNYGDSANSKKTAAKAVTLPQTYDECVAAGISLTLHQQSIYHSGNDSVKEQLYKLIISEFHSQVSNKPAFIMARWVLDTLKDCGAPKLTAYRIAMFAYHLWHDNFETENDDERQDLVVAATKKLGFEIAPHDDELLMHHRTGNRHD